MPNWNYNEVTIYAPWSEVKKWLVWRLFNRAYFFNLHKLFPKRFGPDDKAGFKNWNYDWFIENTGTKWTAEVYPNDIDKESPDKTRLIYETARSPNFGTLERLHQETGWQIEGDYDEPGQGLEGSIHCKDGVCTNEKREYRPVCEMCELKKPESEYDYEADDCICNDCRKKLKTKESV